MTATQTQTEHRHDRPFSTLIVISDACFDIPDRQFWLCHKLGWNKIESLLTGCGAAQGPVK